jgi:heterodisulfide reductase subunit A-like polyferredoxin
MANSPTILYCRCAYAKVVPQDVKDDVLRRLTDADVAFDAVADLCEMSAKGDPALKKLATTAERDGLRIVACYPRAVKWLFSAAGAPLPQEGVQVLNMRTECAHDVARQLFTADTRPAHSGEPT